MSSESANNATNGFALRIGRTLASMDKSAGIGWHAAFVPGLKLSSVELLNRLLSPDKILDPPEIQFWSIVADRPAILPLDGANIFFQLGGKSYQLFQANREKRYIDGSVAHSRRAVKKCTAPEPGYMSSVTNLGFYLQTRYNSFGDVEDLNEAIELYQDTLLWHQMKPGLPGGLEAINNLANSLSSRYIRLGDIKDLEDSIELHKAALRARGDPGRPMTLNNLAIALTDRYKELGEEEDLEEAIVLLQELLSLWPPRHPHRRICLGSLANALKQRYEKAGGLKDLSEAIKANREALSLAPPGHPQRPVPMANLAGLLEMRYKHLGDAIDLGEAIELHREALSLWPSEHPDRPASLNCLAGALLTRCETHDDIEPLNEAIALYRLALSQGQKGDPSRSSALNNLASALSIRFGRTGKDEDIEESIELHREALELHSPGHPNRLQSLSKLGEDLQKRHGRHGTIEDLDESIALHRETLPLRPNDHPERPTLLSNLAATLRARFEQLGEVGNLEESIELLRQALSLLPPGHPGRAAAVVNLAKVLGVQYDRFGETADLTECIAFHRDALFLRPAGYPHRVSSLLSLAGALKSQYDKSQNTDDLTEVITLNRAALSMCPSEQATSRSTSLSSLANALRSLFKHNGDVKYLDEAIDLHRRALSLCQKEDIRRSAHGNNLAGALQARYDHLRETRDLDEAISLHRESLQLRPLGHPYRAASLQDLALALEQRRDSGSRLPTHVRDRDYREICECALAAVDDASFSASARLSWAKHWTELSDADVTFRMNMHSKSLVLLEQMVLINPDLIEQQAKLTSTVDLRSLVSSAVAEAIAAGENELALILLEHGRSVLLGTLQRYRSPVDTLRAVNPRIAEEFTSIGAQLQHLSMSNAPRDTEFDDQASILDRTVVMKIQRQLLQLWDSLLTEIRAVPGFEDFLTAPTYTWLQQAAKDGPVIFLNASQVRCDAIIMRATGPPVVVPLPEVSIPMLEENYRRLTESIQLVGIPARSAILKVLRSLWRTVVAPIMDCPRRLPEGFEGSRVWWCPTAQFTLLPIHAAGLYEGQRNTDLPNSVISSYISTASNLIRARMRSGNDDTDITGAGPSGSVKPRHLFVGYSRGNMRFIKEELEMIKAEGFDSVPLLQKAATTAAVLEKLDQHPWVHFSCRGFVWHARPLESFFQLQGGYLTVQDLIGAHLQKAELAFLSSCHSAAGGSDISDENIHLAAALQFAGFRSVVGTMWETYDEEGPEIVGDFYAKLLELGGRHTDAAAALHFAVRKCLRRCAKQGQGPERWAMFTHIGA